MVGITLNNLSNYATSGASNEAAPSPTFTVSVGATLLVVTETNGHNGGVNVTAMSVGGNALTKQTDSGSVGQIRTTIWTLANPPSGSQTLTITAGAQAQWNVAVNELLGSATTVEATATGTASAAITTSTNNAILITSYGQYGGTIGAPTNGDSIVNNLDGDSNTNGASSWVINGTASTQTVGYNANTPTNQVFNAIAVAPADSSDLFVSLDTSVDGGVSVGADSSYSITCSGTNIALVVGIWNNGAVRTLGNVTVDGTSATLLSSTDFAGGGFKMGIYYVLLGNSTGSHSIVATCPETSVRSIALSLNGANALNGYQGTTATGTSETVTVTAARQNMVVDFAYNSNSNLVQDATQTVITNTAPMKSSRKLGATSVVMKWALAASGNSELVAANVVAGIQPQIKKVSGVARASISKVSGVSLASIKKLSGVTNG